MTIYSWLILVHIFASSFVALGSSIPDSCNIGDDSIGIFGKYISNLTNEGSGEIATSHYSVLLPSRDEFLGAYVLEIESNQDLKNQLVKNHILNTAVEPGTHLSLGGLPVTIIINGDTLEANGYKLRPCPNSDDSSKISFYTIDGFLNDETDSSFSQEVIFRNFRIPVLNEQQLKTLERYGSNFYKYWVANKDVLEDSSYDHHDLIILIPCDDKVSEIDEEQIIQLLASQIIPVNGGLPNLNDSTPGKIHFKNLMGEDVALTISKGNISINGIWVQNLTKVDQIYFIKHPTTLLVTDKITLENPALNYNENELASAFVPPLEDDLIKLFLQMQLHRFLSIWNEVHIASQTQYAIAKENLCALPKKPGPCRLNLPRFYFDGENCRSFVYGGCEGNKNRFHTLRECTESCISNPVKKKKAFQEICNLPFFQPFGTNFVCNVELKKFGYVKDEGHCRSIRLNSSRACFASESLFEDFETCVTYCESNDSGSLQHSPPKKVKPICNISKTCDNTPFNPLQKWVYDEHQDKCVPLETKCKDARDGFYDFEVDCLKSCSINSKKVLTIFAPTDEAIESLPESIWQNNSIFHKELAKKFILSHFLREDAEIDRPTVYEDNKVRIVILHNVINMNEIKETSSFLRSSVGQGTFLPFNGLSQLRKEYLKKNNFAKYNSIYESIYKIMGVKLFNRVHQAISTADAENRQFLNGRNATARGFCQQKLSYGETNGVFSKNTTRYYYNPQFGSCQSFQFSGVGGNSNNFNSYSECSDFCGKFEGLVGELNIVSNKNIVGKALIIQSNPNQVLHFEATLEGLEPDTLYMIEAGLTELMKWNSSTTGTATINEQIEGVNLFGPLSIINNKIIVRKLGKSSEDAEIVAHGSIVIVPNFLEARAEIIHEDNEFIRGEVTLKQDGPFAPVSVFGSVDGIMEGLHGFHVHEIGSTSNGCKGAGSHFNPHEKIHGGPKSEHRHVGDLGNVQVYWGSNLQIHLVDDVISLYPSSINSVMGRTIVIHERKDDLGLAGDFSSLTTGNAGPRIACGIILRRNTSQTVGSSTRNASSLSQNEKGKTFFIPNDHVMSLIFNRMALSATESVREFAFCHYSNQMFDFEAQESNYTTECGFAVHALMMDSSEKGYEIILNGVRAESVIRDGKNTFFVIPFLLYIDDDAIKVENEKEMAFIPRSAFSELPPTEEQFGGSYHSTKQVVQLAQESPQSSLILSISLGPLLTSKVYVRLIENAKIHPSCPPMNNDSFIDFGEIKLHSWYSKYRLSTDRSSLYGPNSIIGHVIVFFDEHNVPLFCGRIRRGEFHDYSDNIYHDFWKRASPLQLPPQDNELKARASELNMNLFFDAWDAALNNGIAVTTSKDENVTVVTLNDDNFQMLMPGSTNRSDHACNQDLFFQRKILGMMIIPGKVDLQALREKDVIMPNTIEDSNLMFSLNEEGSMEIRNFKPIHSESTNSTSLYIVSRSLFMNSAFLGPGDVFDSYDRSVYRVKHPDW